MREQTALVKQFESNDEESIEEYGKTAEDTFILPNRNWNGLIDDYNRTNKKKFPLTPLECRKLVEYAKQSVDVIHVFKAIGISNAKYKMLRSQAQEAEEKLQELAAKEFLAEEELDFFHKLLRHPLRVLIADIGRAEGISEVMDWEKFNKNVENNTELQYIKMKAKYKDYFSDKEIQNSGYSVQIVLGGDYINSL